MTRILPYAIAFAAALVATLILTPLVREINRKLGMVDKPDPRRINKVPIPRGGGLALFIGIVATYAAVMYFGDLSGVFGRDRAWSWAFFLNTGAIVAIGYADDKFSLKPVVKLIGQLLVAFSTWWFGELGFQDLWPWLPTWLDCILTVLWITGAINAFNLIDGLDGLASGLALIATIGMAGGLFFTGHAHDMIIYFSIAGGLLGFLRYNFNPASVFLGDSGSMMLGYLVSCLPLSSHVPNSFLVSIGVPLLAMGVPIFDTSLAIIRRTIRRFLSNETNGKIMSADTDHLHHRMLRAAGMNQRKAAIGLYVLAAALVITGLVGISLQTRAGGVWLAAFAVFATIIFRDMARVEIFDAGALLGRIAHSGNPEARRRIAMLANVFYLCADIVGLALSFVMICWVMKLPITMRVLRTAMLIRMISTFACLVFFRTYVTIWSRAVLSNYLRLALACVAGSIVGSVAIYYLPGVPASMLKAFTLLYILLPFAFIVTIRAFRATFRDLFYAIDCRRLVSRKDVSRVLVYGGGLGYQAFRRELVRSASNNSRIIVGIIDDDILLKNHYIGGVRVMGTLQQAPEIINEANADTVVIAHVISEDWLKVVKETLQPCGVKITMFSMNEKEIQ